MREATALFRAILIGGLVGALPFIWLAIDWVLEIPTVTERCNWHIFVVAAPFCLAAILISALIVLMACMVIGLPLTYYLKKTRRESGEAYIVVGAVSGFILTVIMLIAVGMGQLFWLPFMAALSGAATGASWWRSIRRPQFWSE
jgi:phosphotransferase system  glucose/maltose/N-acetylglucosamine-specific IIC component